jgi:hypothetical protein
MNQETKNNIKIISLLIVVFIILYFLHVTIGDRFEDQYSGSSNNGGTNIVFLTDLTSKTLTVSDIHSQRTCHWSEVVIASGNATLPVGSIDVGDIITNCEGNLVLKWEDTGIEICSKDFS